MNWHFERIQPLVQFLIDVQGALFHVTDELNLSSIAEHGLLSKMEMEARNIAPAHPGGNTLTWSLDRDFGLWDYVFLGFTENGIMPKHNDARWRRRRTLYINPIILHEPGVKIAVGRANHAWTKVYGVARAVEEIDTVAFRQVLTGSPSDEISASRIKKAFDYEVLVPARVAPEHIAFDAG